MIPPVDITSVKSPVLAETTPLPPAASLAPSTANLAQGALGNLTQVAVGQLFQAQVLTQLRDGTFLVNVADNTLRMALPSGTNIGGALPMTLLTTEPRPAFLLEQLSDGSSALLSNAAKVINTVLQNAQQTSASTALVGKTPLLPTPTTNPNEINVVLQDSIEFSGLFYESHVSQWADGQRPFSDLLREPQAQSPALSNVLDSNQTSTVAQTGKSQVNTTGTMLQRPSTTDSELSKLIDNVREASGNHLTLSQALNNLVSGRNLPQEADTVVRSPILSQETAQTINLQLNALEQHRVAWQGELWPGQQFEWEVSDESARNSQTENTPENETSWKSTVRFDLPNLGKISASIHLAGGHVQMRINTASMQSSDTLSAHGKELANALEAAGSPLDSLIIKQDEKT